VLVRVAGTSKFVALTTASQVAVGSIIDVTGGRVRLYTIDAAGHIHFADFYGGIFQVVQLAKDKGVTQLNLVLENVKACKGRASRVASAAKAKKKVLNQLWGSGTGQFRTKGKYASATVRGTTWNTVDRCDGTLVKVTAGVVSVRDLVKKRNVVVKKGQQYLARPR